jgi:CBS domain-containing protein
MATTVEQRTTAATVRAAAPLRAVAVIGPQTALDEAIRLMEEEPLKTVVLVGDGTYMGIFNDAARHDLVPPRADPATLAVGPYVHRARVIAHPDAPIGQVLSLMRRRGQEIAPVVDNNRYLGLVTREDLEKQTSGNP